MAGGGTGGGGDVAGGHVIGPYQMLTPPADLIRRGTKAWNRAVTRWFDQRNEPWRTGRWCASPVVGYHDPVT